MNIIETQKPWGSFRQFTFNEQTTVKILEILKDKKLSLQYHHNRDEFWRVLSGRVRLYIGEDSAIYEAGSEVFIPKETKHRIEGLADISDILEISFGTFDENDIVRLDDDFGRV